ncbi:MAG TPA: hypothetical protein VFR24_07165 [Candidatus Angelobacter sp.]|nr:hypothetical protein [Candidatus Angelobacter sp.]
MSVKVRKLRSSWYVVIDHKGRRVKRKVGGTLEYARGIAREIQERLTRGELGILNKENTAPLFRYMPSNGSKIMGTNRAVHEA